MEYNVKQLGQVFTPEHIVLQILALRKNKGTVLEPSAGNGAFFKHLANCTAIEIDPSHLQAGMLNMDFFDYPTTYKFDTIIGNPPYVRFQDIPSETKKKLNKTCFDERTNLYMFFIEKCIHHLNKHGELIFITPRDFLKATSSIKLNTFLYQTGTITDIIDLGDSKVFQGFTPNCIIWRFEKDNFTRKTFHHNLNGYQHFILQNGQLLFVKVNYTVPFKSIFFVKVGAVSGADEIFTNEVYGNVDFVCSTTYKTGQTRRMIFDQYHEVLLSYKERLLRRKVKYFDETNWWQWGRKHFISNRKRIYVNCKTRLKNPFFVHNCIHYDGSVLAIFPHNFNANVENLKDKLNQVDWGELGFICDGRYIFSQKSLENCFLPNFFEEDVCNGELKERE
ncbi:MAG: class I SAM-dependent methyltransferase [Bacteroidia bacterium]|nr:class I SAM-dependent methyltransferase [Bacteroidia bacterium]